MNTDFYRIDNDAGSRRLVLLLHGYGANEQDLFDLQFLFGDSRVISLRAPLELDPGGFADAFAWFSLDFTPQGIVYDEDEMLEAALALKEFIGKLKKSGDFDEIWLCGFSQGAILSHWLYLHSPELISGAAALSGRFNERVFTSNKELPEMPLFICHGRIDEVIPYESGEQIRDFYGDRDNVEWHSYYCGHGIPPEGADHIMKWFERVSK